jgi:hypothetical protein
MMRVRIFLGSAALLIALTGLSGLPGQMPGFALAQGQGNDTGNTKYVFVDLTPLTRSKTLPDGTHLAKTLEGGVKISYRTKGNQIEEVIFDDNRGHLEKNKLLPIKGNKLPGEWVPRDFTIPADLPPPGPGNHWSCTRATYISNEKPPSYRFIVTCVQLPDLIDPFK